MESMEFVRDLSRQVVTFVKVGHEQYDCPDRQNCGHYWPGKPMLCVQTGIELPEPGGSWSYGDWDECSADEATHVLINATGYSDYSSAGPVEVSNYRSLLRDYPDTFTEVYGGYGTRELMLAMDWTPPGDGRDLLLDDISALADYPLYDEEDMSALEMEQADAAWDDYLYRDVPRELIDRSESPEAMEDAIDALPADGEGSLREMFYDTLYDQPSSPYMESTTSVVFPYMDDSLEVMADRIWQQRCEAFKPRDMLPLFSA